MISLKVHSQETEKISLRKYTQKEGLTSYNIRKIIQDKWGFIWVGTQDGLSRFDGKTFVSYTKNDDGSRKLVGTDVRDIIEDTSENLIWVLPGETGINAISTLTGHVKFTGTIPHLSYDDWNISVVRSGKKLWVGTSTGIQLFDLEQKVFEKGPVPPSLSVNQIGFAVRCIFKDVYENIWCCYDRYGIVVYEKNSRKAIASIPLAQLNDHLNSREIRFNAAVLLSGAVLLSTNQGLRKVFYSENYQLRIENKPCVVLPALNTQEVNGLALDHRDKIWISGQGNLYRFDHALTMETQLQESGTVARDEWLQAVQCIYIDRENNSWLGCNAGLGFISKNKNPFLSYRYDPVSNIKLDHVNTICPLPGDTILVGLTNGLVSIDETTHRFAQQDTGHTYHHIYRDNSGRVHLFRADGQFLYVNNRIIPVTAYLPEFAPYAYMPANSHAYAGDSVVIQGSENNKGILFWYPRQHVVTHMDTRTVGVSLSSDIVNKVFVDHKGRVWVLSDNIISLLSPDLRIKKEIALTASDSITPYKLFFDVCEASGSYWVASYGSGVIQLDSLFRIIKVWGSRDGLSNEGVYQVHNADGRSLIITSNKGISRLDLEQMRFHNYYEEDGLQSDGFEEASGTMAYGKIYAGGVDGLTVINPSAFSNNVSAPVFYFTSVKTDLPAGRIQDTTNLSVHSVTISSNWLQATIHFSALNYTNPHRVIFAYRIKEQGSSWIQLGTRDFITLIGMTPGQYTLEVKAANEDGLWNIPSRLDITIAPKWYQTTAFRIFLLAAILLLFYLVYRYRIGQIQKRQQIRKDIASDLHDDIGSSLNSVKVFLHLARTDTNGGQHLEDMEDSLTEAALGLRDMIWVLDDLQDRASDLLERIKKFATPVALASHMTVDCQMESDGYDALLAKNEKRNLLLIAKEAVNNSIKYSGAKCLHIRLQISRHHKSLLIQDDGKGFDLSAVDSGHGLKNLRYRATQIGYAIGIESAVGSGVTIRVDSR